MSKNCITATPLSRDLGRISHVESLANFYVQLNRTKGDFERLEEVYKNVNTFPPMVPMEDTVCVCRSLSDLRWYRGDIESLLDTCCVVTFIDFGHMGLADCTKVVPSCLCPIPALAQQCSLIIPHGAEIKDDASYVLRDLPGGSFNLDVHVFSTTTPSMVRLYKDGRDVFETYLRRQPDAMDAN